MATFTNQTKNTATMQNLNKKGSGWRYNEPELSYEMTELYYNTFGAAIIFANTTKNAATITNQTKN